MKRRESIKWILSDRSQSEKSIWVWFQLRDIWKRQKRGWGGDDRWAVAGAREAGVSRQSTGMRRAVKLLCVRSRGWPASPHIRPSPQAVKRNTRALASGLWVTITSPYKFFLGLKKKIAPFWWETLVVGESVHGWGHGASDHLCTFLSTVLRTQSCSKN